MQPRCGPMKMELLTYLPLAIILVTFPLLFFVRRRLSEKGRHGMLMFCAGWLAASWARELVAWLLQR